MKLSNLPLRLLMKTASPGRSVVYGAIPGKYTDPRPPSGVKVVAGPLDSFAPSMRHEKTPVPQITTPSVKKLSPASLRPPVPKINVGSQQKETEALPPLAPPGSWGLADTVDTGWSVEPARPRKSYGGIAPPTRAYRRP